MPIRTCYTPPSSRATIVADVSVGDKVSARVSFVCMHAQQAVPACAMYICDRVRVACSFMVYAYVCVCRL